MEPLLKNPNRSTTPSLKTKTSLRRKSVFLKAAAVIALVTALLFCAVAAEAVTYYSFAGYVFSLDGTNASIHAYDGEDTELYIPQYIRSYPVAGIDDYAFFERGDFQKLYFENGNNLRNIGASAFCRCTGIPSAEIPSAVETLGFGAFQECSSLEKVAFSGSHITEIPAQTFYACSSLKEVTLPPSLTAIGDYAFAECGSLEYLEIPASVTEIGEGAFMNAEDLILGVTYGSYAFQYATENGVTCALLDDVKLGDVNGNGYVNINDVTVIQRHLAELERLEGIYIYAADTDQSGDVDIKDATTLQMVLAEYDIPNSVGEQITVRPQA